MARRVVVFITPETIAGQIFTQMYPGTYYRTDAGLPDGSSLVSCGYDPMCHRFWFTYEHESFDDVPENHTIPEFRGFAHQAIRISETMTTEDKTAFEELTRKQIERAIATAAESAKWKATTPVCPIATVSLSDSAMRALADHAQAELAKREGDGEPTATVGG